MIPTSDESLRMPTKLFASGGMMMRHACGQMTFEKARVRLSPVERAASRCPNPVAHLAQAVWKISANQPAYCSVRHSTPAAKASMFRPVTRVTP